jgi:hypothetical protein
MGPQNLSPPACGKCLGSPCFILGSLRKGEDPRETQKPSKWGKGKGVLVLGSTGF